MKLNLKKYWSDLIYVYDVQIFLSLLVFVLWVTGSTNHVQIYFGMLSYDGIED